MEAPPFTLTNDSVTVIWDGKPITVQRGTPNFEPLRAAIRAEKWDDIPKHLTIGKSLSTFAHGKFVVKEGRFFYNEEALPENINERMVAMANSGQDPTPMFNFWEKLQKNPSWRSVKQLWGFLEHRGIPITNDGCFLAYKGVNNNYTDKYTGKFLNKPGAVMEMPRNNISDDPNEACHEGFHVGALDYARDFGAKVVICKVDPADVVCVPYDSSQQKMRVCKYKVMGNWNGSKLPDTTFLDEEHEKGEDVVIDDTEVDESEKKDKPSEEKKKRTDGKVSLKTKEFAVLDGKEAASLMEESIDVLRKYAANGLKIVGASKIPGGKTALVSKIIEVRGDNY